MSLSLTRRRFAALAGAGLALGLTTPALRPARRERTKAAAALYARAADGSGS